MIINTLDPTNPRVTYTREHDQLTAAQIWDAWRKQLITVFQFSEWQDRHKYYFDPIGGRAK